MVQRLGNYDMLERIGRGGMGSVYRAHQRNVDRIVAVKILPKKLAENHKNIQRFVREAQSSGALSHVNLVQAYEFGKEGDYYFLSMEYIEGGSLRQHCKDVGPLAEEKALRLMRQIAKGLSAAHKKGYVHRDVKPDNILLTQSGDGKLCDLGLAKPVDGAADITAEGVAVGTPHYLSPGAG